MAARKKKTKPKRKVQRKITKKNTSKKKPRQPRPSQPSLRPTLKNRIKEVRTVFIFKIHKNRLFFFSQNLPYQRNLKRYVDINFSWKYAGNFKKGKCVSWLQQSSILMLKMHCLLNVHSICYWLPCFVENFY